VSSSSARRFDHRINAFEMKIWRAVAAGCYQLWPGIKIRIRALNLIDLVVLACTLVNPGACHEYHLLFQSAGSLRTCTMQAQPYLAQWIGEHPSLRVARWHCAWPNQEDQKI
jgi:hypothetical protein